MHPSVSQQPTKLAAADSIVYQLTCMQDVARLAYAAATPKTSQGILMDPVLKCSQDARSSKHLTLP